MNFELIWILLVVVGLFFGLRPVRSKYKLERYKPLVIIPIVIIPVFQNGGFGDKSAIKLILSGILIIYVVWKTYKNHH